MIKIIRFFVTLPRNIINCQIQKYFMPFQTIYGSGKSIESIILGMLHSEGLFKFDDKVSKYWPEFAQNGKEDVRICDILR